MGEKRVRGDERVIRREKNGGQVGRGVEEEEREGESGRERGNNIHG